MNNNNFQPSIFFKPKEREHGNPEEIITQVEWETKINEDGDEVRHRKETKINLTKQLAETMKVLKYESIEEKIKELRNSKEF